MSLEPFPDISVERAIEIVRRHAKSRLIHSREVPIRALAKRHEESPHAVLVPAELDELAGRVLAGAMERFLLCR